MARRFGKFLTLVVVCALGVFLALYLSLLGLEAYSAGKAAKVLSEIESLRIGDPVANFEKVVSGIPTRYSEHVLTAGAWEVIGKLPRPLAQVFSSFKLREILCRAGLRWWELGVSADVQHAKLSALSVWLLVDGRYEMLGTRWTLTPGIPWPESEMELTGDDLRTPIGWFHITSARGGEGIRINATDLSTKEELAARTVNRKCLLSFRGCGGFCELLPDVVPVLKERKRNWGTSTGVPRAPCDPVPEKQADVESPPCQQ